MIEVEKEKIINLLNSSDYKNGFELLHSINDKKLNDELSDIISSTIKIHYLDDDGENKIEEGLKILAELTPDIKSLDLNGDGSFKSVKKIDVSYFKELTHLNLNCQYFLEGINGIEKLKNLIHLDLRCTNRLINLDIEKLKNIKEIFGLRDKYGIWNSDNTDWDYWNDNIIRIIEDNLYTKDNKEAFGHIALFNMSEYDYWNSEFNQYLDVAYLNINQWIDFLKKRNLPESLLKDASLHKNFPNEDEILVLIVDINPVRDQVLYSVVFEPGHLHMECLMCFSKVNLEDTESLLIADIDDEVIEEYELNDNCFDSDSGDRIRLCNDCIEDNIDI